MDCFGLKPDLRGGECDFGGSLVTHCYTAWLPPFEFNQQAADVMGVNFRAKPGISVFTYGNLAAMEEVCLS